MTRKIIQIAACGVEENYTTQGEALIFALCDDGTLWRTDNRCIDERDCWTAVPEIPQSEDREPPDAA